MASDHIGRYELQEQLGVSSEARMWNGYDPMLQRKVLIREPLFDESLPAETREELVRRFVEEGQVIARLRHPNIVSTFAVGAWEGVPAAVVEPIEGKTLSAWLQQGPLSANTTLAMLDQLLEALNYAHRNDVVHGDIKTDNVYITGYGAAKLGGFDAVNVHYATSQRGARSILIEGTPGYLSPEQASGQPADERSDIFSLAVVAYEMLTGHNPFGAHEGVDAATILQRTIQDRIPDIMSLKLEDGSEDPRPAIMRALSKHPVNRPQTAEEFKTLLHGHRYVQQISPVLDGLTATHGTSAEPAQASTPNQATQVTTSMVQGFVPVREFGATHGYQAGRNRTRSRSHGWLPYVLLAAIAAGVLGFALRSILFGSNGILNFNFPSPSIRQQDTGQTGDATETGESEAGQQDGTTVAVRSSLADYSWDELGIIAQEIEACTSSESALAVAQSYHLVDASGTYLDATKSIDMLDGQTLNVRLVGIWHDDGDTASGKTGLSFLADDIVYQHQMSKTEFMPGGWELSELRAWLSSELYQKFPAEVSSHMVSTSKYTNNVGETHFITSVTETKEMLWVPSIVEIAGPLDWVYSSHPEYQDDYNAIFNAEGTQYPAFAQVGINTDGANPILNHGKPWWTRSTAPASSRARYVSANGNPADYGDANANHGVLVGFCF